MTKQTIQLSPGSAKKKGSATRSSQKQIKSSHQIHYYSDSKKNDSSKFGKEGMTDSYGLRNEDLSPMPKPSWLLDDFKINDFGRIAEA